MFALCIASPPCQGDSHDQTPQGFSRRRLHRHLRRSHRPGLRRPAPGAKALPVNQTLTSTLRYEVKVLGVENLGASAALGPITAKADEKTGQSVWAISLAVGLARTGDRKGGLASETPPILGAAWFGVYADHPPQHKETRPCQCVGFYTDKSFDQVIYSAERQITWQGKLAVLIPAKPTKLYLCFVNSNIIEIPLP